MITKEKIIEILHSHSYNVEDQAGNHLIVVDDDSWDAVATEVKNCSIPDVSVSLRDKFAIAAMNGELSAQNFKTGHHWANEIDLAERAYLIADAMMKARSNES